MRCSLPIAESIFKQIQVDKKDTFYIAHPFFLYISYNYPPWQNSPNQNGNSTIVNTDCNFVQVNAQFNLNKVAFTW